MQFNPTTPSSSSSAAHPHKRSFAQQASALQTKPESPKVPRIDTSEPSSFSTSRKATKSARPEPIAPPAFQMPQSSSSRPGRGFGVRPAHPTGHPSSSRFPNKRAGKSVSHLHRHLEGPVHDQAYITRTYRTSPVPLKSAHEATPKSSLGNFSMLVTRKLPTYKLTEGFIVDEATGKPTQYWRATVTVHLDSPVIGIGDHAEKKQAEKLGALSAVYQLHNLGVLDAPMKLRPKKADLTEVTLSDTSVVTYERARNFMDYYCRRYGFGKPEITFEELKGGQGWEAIMNVGGRRIGLGSAATKKNAQIACYLDVTQYLESCDAELWKTFVQAAKSGADLGLAPKVFFQMSDRLDDEIRDLCADIKKSVLYRNRPAIVSVPSTSANQSVLPPRFQARRGNADFIAEKSKQLLKRRQDYLANPAMERMRKTRMSLPVYTRADDVISHIRDNDVTICMATTGSGKTTQIPQLILDAYIERGEGANCNIVCTQPRRLAAISVADRVAKERGETVGKSIGYQVRFEAKVPEEHGCVTFCTTGMFLKRLQSALSDSSLSGSRSLDDVTHIIVDEVHERDVDTDLLLVVLKRLMADRKARNKPLKVVLMSATIDPTLFQRYFPDENSQPAKVIEVPGRSFPVTKQFLEDFVPNILTGQSRWILGQESVSKYLNKELGPNAAAALGVRPNRNPNSSDDEGLEMPYPLIGATISHVLQSSDDGHVLVFLPGWDDIVGVQRCLQSPQGPLGLNFNDTSKFSLHLLHSTIPLAEQQVIFEPPPQGVRRIILATNIAETSITIPDVVYVVDTAKVKEQRYDPERHMSSLVSAWVGSSNLNQRAGRAGRHRPGEYYGILSRAHSEALHPYQTVEMKRVDLSNVVMHVKALNFPGMAVEDVLAATIEAPLPERVAAAMKDLQMVGALDADKNLTSLGRVLLQLPVEAQMGRLVLYGSFFRCLDQALTLAAILTNREPFVSPMHLKAEAAAKKNSWTPQEFRSDALATLQAFNAWWAMQSRGEYVSANRFCMDNFLAKPTLLMIQKIKGHLLQSLYHAGVIDVSAGGLVDSYNKQLTVPPELNANGDSLPLLAALISIASQPKFAIRVGERTYRTSQDKVTFIHPSSVNHRKRELSDQEAISAGEKQLFAFTEKRQNVSSGAGSGAQTFLVTTTRLDPMTYMLFGAYKLQVTERGLECDNWLPIVGNLDALDDVQRLKILMEACMLRVFEGITMSRRHRRGSALPIMPREEESETDDEDEDKDYSLSRDEIKELDLMTRDVVRILDRYSAERAASQSRQNSRPATPMGSPSIQSTRLPGSSLSGYSTPNFGGSAFSSRPSTPSRLSRRF
ncbi:ATP-dependent RNA helicase DHX36 [Hypsizygus marmoreus]|uniref:ATP-dependent RNA helicase DHX36 n=1 Tax=Hypsizygus marmoreus TaxID=39966 RepID=A0A369K6Y7_HYPMA|nr:ATP-dependent RNA helicase DHX36 [Hypsizygus marmoreus]